MIMVFMPNEINQLISNPGEDVILFIKNVKQT
jgi:hypothetical protein